MSMMPLLPVAACMMASATLLLFCVLRRLRNLPTQPPGAGTIPWPVRCVRWPAWLLEPLVNICLSPLHARRLAASLETLELAPAISAAGWESARCVHAILAAATAGLATGWSPGWMLIAALPGYLAAGGWLRRHRLARERSIGRELPAWLDLMTVCVEAGATLTAGIRLIVAQAPDSPLRSYFERVLREIRGGRARAQAFAHVADLYAVESLSTMASALSHAESAGMSLGQVLRIQSAQRTAERFAHAERLAMQAPVKMLGPLILCIFPCTFIVLAVPITVRLMEAFGK